MSRAGDPQRITESDPNGDGTEGLAGSMGVSSERIGAVRGSDEEATHGAEETTPDV
ncbi:MAG: hypothetical protein JWP74_2093 [Marmoricola sp.]|nr:hypothetical protein [Marmoricola sp.]